MIDNTQKKKGLKEKVTDIITVGSGTAMGISLVVSMIKVWNGIQMPDEMITVASTTFAIAAPTFVFSALWHFNSSSEVKEEV